jgi:phospholipase/lecithinase/hemolysin
MQHCVNGQTPQVPCIFVFGDSLSDSGNNNNLVTNAKANYNPYGVDFPTGSNGSRFTNGRTSIDYIGNIILYDATLKSIIARNLSIYSIDL